MSDRIIIGVDHGYAAMKTAHCVFPAGLVEYAHEPYTSRDVLEYDGKFFVVGSGRQPLQKDKTAGENYYLLTLAAIAKELEFRKAGRSIEVILAAGLPLTSFGRDKAGFKRYLLRDGRPVSFRYEGRPYEVTVSDVILLPQGYSAVMTQTDLLLPSVPFFRFFKGIVKLGRPAVIPVTPFQKTVTPPFYLVVFRLLPLQCLQESSQLF